MAWVCDTTLQMRRKLKALGIPGKLGKDWSVSTLSRVRRDPVTGKRVREYGSGYLTAYSREVTVWLVAHQDELRRAGLGVHTYGDPADLNIAVSF